MGGGWHVGMWVLWAWKGDEGWMGRAKGAMGMDG